ncbi:MAG: HAD-IC family P-type ATPase, partial [Pseudomonadota bacterium]
AGTLPARVEDLRELPGAGLSAWLEGREIRLGRANWCAGEPPDPSLSGDGPTPVADMRAQTRQAQARQAQTRQALATWPADFRTDDPICYGVGPQSGAHPTGHPTGHPAGQCPGQCFGHCADQCLGHCTCQSVGQSHPAADRPFENPSDGASEVWLGGAGLRARFRLSDALKPDAAASVAALRARGLPVALLSGDAPAVVAACAAQAGIEDWQAGLTPADKARALAALAATGRRVCMVGDGINDALALAAAHVSVAPASGTDIARAAADLVIPADRLAPLLTACTEAGRARRRALENFGIAALYNLIAIPVAVAGLVSPLVAALAMSGSSILVTLNALRRGGGR